MGRDLTGWREWATAAPAPSVLQVGETALGNRQGLVGDEVGEGVTRSRVPGRGSLVGCGQHVKKETE